MPAKRTLTRKQQEVFEFVQRYFAANDASPLIREIQEGCRIGSYKSVLDRLNALERKGMIRRRPNKHRGIKLVRQAGEPAPETAAPPAIPPPVEQAAVDAPAG
jgi:repressor LexA